MTRGGQVAARVWSDEGEGALCLCPFLQEDGGSTELGTLNRDGQATATCRRASLAACTAVSMAGSRPTIGCMLVTWICGPTQTIEWCLSLGTWPSCAVVSPCPSGEGGAGAAPYPFWSRARGEICRESDDSARCNPLGAGKVSGWAEAWPSCPFLCLRRSCGWAAVVTSCLGLAPRPFYRKTP